MKSFGLSSLVTIIFSIMLGVFIVVLIFGIAGSLIPALTDRIYGFVCNFPILDTTLCKSYYDSKLVDKCLTELGGWGEIREGVRESRQGYVTFGAFSTISSQILVGDIMDVHCADGDKNPKNKECWLGAVLKNGNKRYYLIQFSNYDSNNQKISLRVFYGASVSYKDSCNYQIGDFIEGSLGKGESLKIPDGLEIKATNLASEFKPATHGAGTLRIDFTFELLLTKPTINVFDTQGCLLYGGNCYDAMCGGGLEFLGYCDNNKYCCR